MREITIQLTERCNLACKYCFAGNKSGAEISADNLNFFIDFCKKNAVESVHVTGGEPTLYRNFSNCIEELAKNFYLVIYSNFTVQDTIKNLNLRDSDLIFLVNINPRENYTTQQWDNLIGNIETAKTKNIRLAFGHTFHRSSIEEDFKYIVSMNQKYGVKLLRLSQAISNSNTNTNALNINQVRKLYSLVAAKYESLKEVGIKCYFDCPLPACWIGEKVYDKLREGFVISTNCAPKIFVTYDLKAHQCYIEPKNLLTRSLREFTNYDAVKNYLAEMITPIVKEKSLKCKNCPHSKFLFGCGCPIENSYKVEE